MLTAWTASWAGPAVVSPRVLLTGFDAFDHESSNPSREIAQALNGSCIGSVCIESLVLSVNTAGAALVASQLSNTNTSPWAAIIHVGEDVPAMFRKVKKMHVELVAANLQSHAQPSAAAGPYASQPRAQLSAAAAGPYQVNPQPIYPSHASYQPGTIVPKQPEEVGRRVVLQRNRVVHFPLHQLG